MIGSVMRSILMGLLILACAPPHALAEAVDDRFFSEKLYPVFEAAQCRVCHSDNGVASGTRFEFPAADAPLEIVQKFGRSLAVVVDSSSPLDSLLFRKPTNRLKHTGGERIPMGSSEEGLLRSWVEYLARNDLADSRGVEVAGAVVPVGVRRLTHSQYNNAVRDLLGELSRPADTFAAEDFVNGFKNQTDGQGIPPLLMEAYSAAAENVSANAFRGGDRNGLIPCEPNSAVDRECLVAFVREFGKKVFRRPLSHSETERIVESALPVAAEAGEFTPAAKLVAEAMLQSPNFLLRVPRTPTHRDRGYDIAERLSFFLWNTTPGDALLDAAARGDLDTIEGVRTAARRMLEDARSEPAMDEFFEQWMRLDRLRATIRDRKFFPEFNAELAGAMANESRELFGHLVWNDADFREFFTANYTFVNDQLAALYAAELPAKPFGRVDFPPDSNRAGVLGQAAYLTLTSKPSDTSPTERGLFVREHFLCQVVPPPPPGVSTTLPALTDELPMTNRQRLSVHLTSETCSSCHRLIDPIGLGLEQFDAIGRFRATQHIKILPTRDEVKRKLKTKPTEYDLDIDASGTVAGIADSDFQTPKELGAILSQDEGCQKCIVKMLFRYALGRHETAADRTTIENLLATFKASQFRFRDLIIAIATSEPFLAGPT